MEATIFNSWKGIRLMIGVILLSGALALGLPFLFNGAPFSIILGALLFFLIPMICFPIIKKQCLTEALLFSSQQNFQVKNDDGKGDFITWNNVEKYRVELFSNFSGRGFLLKLYLKDSQTFKISIIDQDVWLPFEGINPSSILYKICQDISNYNKNQPELSKIHLRPSPLDTKIGIILMFFLIAIVIFDLIYHLLPHSLDRTKNPVMIFLVIALVGGFFAQRKKNQKLYDAIKNIDQ